MIQNREGIWNEHKLDTWIRQLSTAEIQESACLQKIKHKMFWTDITSIGLSTYSAAPSVQKSEARFSRDHSMAEEWLSI